MSYSSKRWKEARRAALARDDHHCQDCGASDDLHVHHIRPVESFESTADAHYLDNLVTLCEQCHPKWEGRPGAPSHGIAQIGLGPVITDLVVDTLNNETMAEEHERVFEKFIIGNPTVCSRCLRRVYDVGLRPVPQRYKYLDWVLDEEWFPHATASVEHPPPKGENWERPANTSSTAVCECGEIGDYGGDCEALEGSVSEDELIEVGERVVERLKEEGVLLNEDAFFKFLRTAKSKPGLQGHNYNIMKRAVSFGLKRSAQKVDGRPGSDSTGVQVG